MLLDLQPSKSSELVPFQSCCAGALDSCEFTNTHCGLSSDGSLTWIYRGAALEVVSTSTGHRVASLDAQHLLRDEEAVVTCVSEFPCQSRPRLVVAMRGSAEQGMVVLLDVASSLIVKAVEIPQQVTALEKVLTYGGTSVPSWALSEQLRQFYGIVAVGTEGGYVYLVDLALDWTYSVDSSQKIMPCPLRLLEPRERDVQGVRQLAFQAGQHLALRLGVDEQSHRNDCFHFRSPDLTVRQSFNEDEVHVSSLKYIPQSGTLAIGYSFGGFHLWKLLNPVIEYASTVEVEDLPVAFFVYQEPENDPKNFAYLWVCRDDRLSEQKQESISSVSLYQLSYSRRTFYANYGNFFEELNLLTLRLEHHLTVEPYNNRNNTTWSSQLLSAFIITDHSYHPSARLIVNDSFEEGCQGPDLSLCAFAWEAQDSRPGSRNEVFLAVFDMNRWYHAQMPARIKCVNVEGQELCPFLAVYSMNDAVYREGSDNLVDIQVKPGSLLRFVNNSPMPPEQHYYPSSLAFDTVCVLSSGIVTASILGVQRQVLASLESNGPLCLLKPFDLYHRCLQTGLMARSTDSSVALSTEEQQRMSLLTLALDQGQIHFITSCISSWADGDYIQQGCTLQFILTWAWARITAIKQQIDLTCRPLFDWSEAPVDQRMLQVLQNSLCCLGHLRTILHTLMTQSSPVSQQGEVELEHRMRVVALLHYHLKVMLWFVHNGLLPEHEDTGKSSPMHYVYPASELAQVFADRRRQMTQNPSTANTHEMILIDAMVHSAGDILSELWKNEEGTGMYPPPNLHAALSVYLLDGVEEKTKNAITLYLLFDMAAVAHGQQEEFAEKIPRFARAFDLPLGLVQQIHGFWLIDHMNFQEGLNQLRLRSGQDLGPWQHSCILRALMHQGERAAALRYLSLRNPPMLTAEDVKMRLNILMANRLVNQAMTFVRNSCGPGDQEPMLKYIFSLCQQQKLMNVLLKLPLTEKEEKCLQSFLSDNTDSAAAELLVLHLLQKSQYVPAIRLNDRMKHRATMDMSNKARERFKTRNSIVEGFRQSLPATQQYLINNPPAPFKMPTTLKIEVPRPKPLSTIVTQRVERRANSKSTMILAVMDKVAEAGKLIAEEEGLDDKDEEEDMVIPQSQSLLLPKKELTDREPVAVNKPGPFLCTPTTTPRHYARRSHTGQVVFPTVKGMTQALLSSAALTSPLSPAANRRSQVFTADCMSLLQTPKIDHTPAKVASPVRSTTTPHSILKVSRLPRSSPRTKGVSRSPRGQPKRLGFSTSTSQYTPLPSTPTSLTPSSTPSPTSAAEPMSFKAVTVDQSKAEKSLSELATPKQIRFSEPEIREISPPYVSPDSLARPPLRSSPDEGTTSHETQNSLQQDTSSGEAMVQSDEEITFNISHQVAEPMDAGNESDSSTLPIATPSPATDRAPFATPVPPSPSPEPVSVQSEDQEYVQLQAHQSEQNTTTTDSSPKGQLSRSSLYDRASEKETSLRDRSPLSVRTSIESEVSRSQSWRLSPHRSPISFSRDKADHKETVAQTSVFTETKRTSFISRERTYQCEIKIESEESVAAAKETALLRKTEPQEALPVMECEKESEAQPDQSAQSMETIEPDEDNILIEARQASCASSKNIVEELEHETVEVAADDELDLEIQVPTPIRHSSRRSTPERSVRSTRTTRRTGLKIDLTAVDKEKERTEPTPPKLRRISPSREKPPEDAEWPEVMPSLQLEFSDDDDNNSNENHLRPTLQSSSGRNQISHSPPVSPSQKDLKSAQRLLSQSAGRESVDHSPPFSQRSRRSSDRSPPISPLQRAAGSGEKSPVSPKLSVNVDRSPPVSPLRRSTRSVDRSPPVSPSRRSTRSVDCSPPVSPSRRSTRSVDRSPPVSASRGSGSVDRSPPGSPSRRSTRSVDHSLPVSPSRRSTRSVDRSPPVSPSRKSARSVDGSPPVSPSRRSTRSVDRSPPVSPSHKSTRDADHSIPTHSSKRTATSGHPSPSRSPSRSTRSADRSPPPSPSRASRQRDTEQVKSAETDLPVVKSRTIEELTVQTESAGEELMPPPVSPPRRSSRLRTPERSPGRKEGTPERTTKTQSVESREEISEMPDSTSPVDIGESLADVAAKSPTRRSQRAKTPDIVTQTDSKPELSSESEQPVHVEESQSPSRRNTRQTKEMFTPRTPSRRSTRRSKTPELSTAEPASSSKQAGQKSKASEKSLSAAFKSEKHEGESQQRTLKQETLPTASGKVSSSSRRSTRSRSKTPEPFSGHVATRLREKGKVDQSENISEEVKDITTATEEVRTMRKQQRDASSRATTKMSPVAQETGDAPSFQFAAPTPLSRVHTDSLPAPPTDVSTFIFSPPITRSTRSQRGSTSSTSTSKSTRSRGKKEVSVTEESMDVVPEIDESASKDKSETSTRQKISAKSGKKTKRTRSMPSASPSDSPISLLSPGEPDSSEAQPDSSEQGTSRKTKKVAGATSSRVLRKRKVKLW